MKFKNINPVERFFEKVVFLAALGGSFYFIYASYVVDPNTVGPTNSKPGEIEELVSKTLADYNDALKNQPPYVVTPAGYVQAYIGHAKNPLPPDLLLPAPPLAPEHLAIEIGPGNGPGTGPQIAPIPLPAIPPLANQNIVSARTVISVPGVASAAPSRRDLTYIKGTADLNIKDLDDSINKIPIPMFQKTAIYRIHVQRQEQNEDGSWTAWADVLPLQPVAALDPKITATALPEIESQLRTNVKSIIEPEFISAPQEKTDVTPDVPRPPTVDRPPPRLPPQRTNLPVAPRGNRRPGRSLPPGFPGGQFPNFNPPPPPPDAPDQLPPPGPGPADINAGPALTTGNDFFGLGGGDTIPIWFWDDQVLPEHTYRYQARVEIINPLYQLPNKMETVPPEGKNQLLLASDYTKFDPVTVEADEYYFLTPDNLTVHEVASAFFKVYKWHENLWYAAEDRVEPAMTVGGIKSVPRPGMNPIKVNFGAVYTVIDIQTVTTPAGTDVQVVLLNNTTGRLVLRDLLNDSRDPQKQKLDDIIHKQTATPVSAARGPASPAE
jgi:hypothetical protein